MNNVWQLHRVKEVFTAIASGGANGVLAEIGPFGREGRVNSLRVVFTGADQPSAAGSYREIRVVNVGTGGAGTTVLAAVNNVGAVAIGSLSNGKAGTVTYPANASNGSLGTYGADQMLQITQLTVGGTNATATILAAGYVEIMLESIGG